MPNKWLPQSVFEMDVLPAIDPMIAISEVFVVVIYTAFVEDSSHMTNTVVGQQPRHTGNKHHDSQDATEREEPSSDASKNWKNRSIKVSTGILDCREICLEIFPEFVAR